MKRDNVNIRKMTYAAICLVLTMVLPFLTGQIPQIGNALSPMHIPVFLCGFLCGWPWAMAVGFIAPPLRFLLFGMPPIMPTGVAMMFELAAYGAIAGLLYKRLPRKPQSIYLSLIASMVCGRVVWGIVRFLLAGLQETTFSFSLFIAGAVTTALPGIILHLVLVPLLVLAMERAKIILNE